MYFIKNDEKIKRKKFEKKTFFDQKFPPKFFQAAEIWPDHFRSLQFLYFCSPNSGEHFTYLDHSQKVETLDKKV